MSGDGAGLMDALNKINNNLKKEMQDKFDDLLKKIEEVKKEARLNDDDE